VIGAPGGQGRRDRLWHWSRTTGSRRGKKIMAEARIAGPPAILRDCGMDLVSKPSNRRCRHISCGAGLVTPRCAPPPSTVTLWARMSARLPPECGNEGTRLESDYNLSTQVLILSRICSNVGLLP